MRCGLVNSSSSRSSSDRKKFSLLREFNQQQGTASSLQAVGMCVRVSQGRVGCRKGACLHRGSALSPLMLLSLWSWPCCNCCCLCRHVNASPAALSHAQSTPTLLQGKAPSKVPLAPVFPRHREDGDEDPLWHKAWCGNSHLSQLPGFQAANLIMKSQPLPRCRHLCYSFLRVALSHRVQGVRQTDSTACMLIA